MRRRSSVKILISTSCFQLISCIQRQVFDFLGHQWMAIFFNFISILAVILLLFGINSTFRAKFVIIYLLWQLISLAWNFYLITFYVGIAPPFENRDENFINLWTGSRSWWEANGPNCRPTYGDTSFLKPSQVNGCLINFEYLEILQSAFQIIISIITVSISCYLLYLYHRSNQDDTFIRKPNIPSARVEHATTMLPPYSITLQNNTGRRSVRSTRSRASRRSTSRRRRKSADAKLISRSERNLSSSFESLNNAQLNPLYNHYSRGSRYSLYTITSQRHSPIYMNSETMI